ncbi:neurofilament medium polypeptide [Corythoichthys intestinalis]|uniref:neurofilament medium polypeptide n=1 Tax=Corythoichthys intestinalis TaxID=161448 RepID=UPI0025A64598|nr:neurofilament medium polypeptide [Corythoichthys intestinalis]
MFCRRFCQRLGPIATRVFTPTYRKAPVRHMAFGVPGGSPNMTYVVLCGGSLTAAVVYGYKTIIGDSERYEERLANMGSTAKVEASSAEPVTAAAEPAPVEEPVLPVELVAETATAEPAPVEETVLPVELVAESVALPAEPVDESAVEPVVENATTEDVGAVSEIIAQDEAEPAAVEEAPTVLAEAAPTSVEIITMEATPTEAPASSEAATDLLTAVKILAGATEIAAASVGESSLVRAVRHIEEDGKALDSVLEVLESEVLERTEERAAKEPSDEMVTVINEEAADRAVVSGDEEVTTEDKVSVEVILEEASFPASDEEEEVPPDEAAPLGPTEENASGIQAEDQNPAPEEVAPSADSSITAEAQVDQELPAAQTAVEEGAEAPAEETVATLEEECTTQPPEPETEAEGLSEPESGSEAEGLSVAEQESNCHHDSLAEVSNSAVDQPTETEENSSDESASTEEAKSPEAVVVVMSQS